MKDTLLIVIHGRGGSPETSKTVQAIDRYFFDVADIVTPTYSEKHPFEATREYFDTFIKDYSEYSTIAVIGNSLGGYWARYLANRIRGASFIGINPSFNFYGNDIESDNPNTGITIYVAKDDAVVDYRYAADKYKNRGKVVVLEHGGHRLAGVLSEILPCISKDIFSVWQ